MKNIIGFSIEDAPAEESVVVPPKEESAPVRSLVQVRFLDGGRSLTYFNDKLELEIGDRVFVSGKLAGKPGIVEKITTKFKINLADYQRVISKANPAVHGTYESIIDKMVSYDHDAMSPEEFRAWILPPEHWDGEDAEEQKDEVIFGDGYELNLLNAESNDDINEGVLNRAADYCQSGRVEYICVRDGIGTAFVNGTKWYEISFQLNGDIMSEMYCDCFYPGLCKHLLAVGMSVRAMAMHGHLDYSSDFVAIDNGRFWDMVSHTTKKVTL